jgi:phosphatidylglycerol:prolipoprotein diacylglycerol transferase
LGEIRFAVVNQIPNRPMRQTLFFIPHEIAGVQVFGFGWLLAAWVAVCVVWLGWLVRRQGWTAETRSHLPYMVLVALGVAFVLPWIEAGKQGLPVRGYGVMLLAATLAGVSFAVRRARQMGVDPDVILKLAVRMFVGGLIGARVFFVIQYWPLIQGQNLLETVVNAVNFVEGGLVVYGALIGGLLAGLWYARRYRLPVLAVGDLIAPSLALGLALGRLGCLLNGCCFGGLCDLPWAITFPGDPASPPYSHQKQLGILHGIRLASDDQGLPVLKRIDREGRAAATPLVAGARVEAINGHRVRTLADAQRVLEGSGPALEVTTEAGTGRWTVGQLPARSLPVHPTQIYSSINAALLFMLLATYYPFRRRDGEVITLLLALYGVSRFLLEVIRADEGSFLHTGLTISQNVSIVLLAVAAVLGIYVVRQPWGSVWPASPSPAR